MIHQAGSAPGPRGKSEVYSLVNGLLTLYFLFYFEIQLSAAGPAARSGLTFLAVAVCLFPPTRLHPLVYT